MAFDFSTLITDRSPEDLQALRDLLATPMADWTAEQLAEFNRAASKGSYNYTDLNRVIAAMDDINERLTAAGYVTGYQRIRVPHQGGEDIELPEGYTRLAWIESTGSQYIDTGITPTQDTQIVLDYMPTAVATVAVFGSRVGVGNAAFALWIVDATSIEDDYASDRDTITVSNLLERTCVVKDGNILDYGDIGHEHTETVFSNQYPIALFGINSAGTVDSRRVSARLYSCSIRTGTDKRDYIPCRAPDGSVGLYDLVDGQFYGNVGTGAFLAGPVVVDLPEGYTELQYIESTGTQRINTGIKPDGNTRATVDIQISDAQTTEGHLFSVTGNKYFVVSFNPQLTAWWRTRHGSSVLTSFPASANTRGRCIVDKNQNITTVNEEIVTLPEADFSLNYNMNLFCRNARGQFNAFLSAKLYSCQIYQAGELVRNFVPCLSPTGDVGLYDLCENKFYGNSGTGVFIGGPEIVTPDPEPPSDPYTWYESDVPTSSLLSAYLANVGNLKDTLILPTGTPAVPDDMAGLTQTEANNIEKILEIINEYLVSLQKIFLRCGHAICGNNFYFAN